MKSVLSLVFAVATAVAGFAGAARAAPTPYGPTPYLSAADSPFNAIGFGYFYRETFEDHLLNTPGVSANAGGVTSVVFGPAVHDSVDADDGVIDGSGLLGDSYFLADGSSGVKFSFNAGVLGALPTHAGIVWTDGAGAITFKVFGANGLESYSATYNGIPDGSFAGGTAEDRFFGAFDASGISAIFISNSAGGMEVDHLQYGAASAAPPVAAIPEPQTYALMLAGLLVCAWRIKRRQP